MPMAQGVSIPETERSVDVDAPIDVVWGTITDYEAYPQFVREVVAARVVWSEGNAATVDFTLSVVKRFSYRVRLVAQPPCKLSWSLVSGEIFTENEGTWELEPTSGGAATRVTYRVRVGLDLFIPRAVRNQLVALTLPDTLQQFRAEAERRATSMQEVKNASD